MASVEGLFIARQGALVTLDGVRTIISQGQTARAGHPVLASCGHLFAPLTIDFDVEPEPEAPKKPAAARKTGGQVPA
jgi:hypothetical protein